MKKKSLLLFTFASLSLVVIISRSLAGPGSSVATKEKEAVDKVLAGHAFTPPVAIEGPNNSVWYVSARSFNTNSIEQVMVNVRGQTVTLQMSAFERAGQGWEVRPIPPAAKANLQRKVEDEIRAQAAKEQ